MSALRKKIQLIGVVLAMFFVASFTQQSRSKLSCDVADQSTSSILAITWHPGFCKKSPAIYQCRQNEYRSYGLVLHGLWPSKKQACGIRYTYCSDKELTPETLRYLKRFSQILPQSTNSNSWFLRHEWKKHGTCQTTLTQKQYFQKAIQLTNDVKISEFNHWLVKHSGQKIDINSITQKFTESFPNIKTINLQCSAGSLYEIRIPLMPIRSMVEGSHLNEMKQPDNIKHYSNCKGTRVFVKAPETK